MQLKALLIRGDREGSEQLRESLVEAGHDVVGEATIDDDLLKRVEATQADLLVIDNDSPGNMLLSQIRELESHTPLPVVLFTGEHDPEVIQQAVCAGVNAYIVDGGEQHRLATIVDVAVARFRETDRLGNCQRYSQLVLATGSRPHRPSIAGAARVHITSD